MRSFSSGHAALKAVSSRRSPSLSTYLFLVSVRARSMKPGFPSKIRRISFSVSSHDFHLATQASMSSDSIGAASSSSSEAVEASVPMPTLKPCDTCLPSNSKSSISQKWLNWCSMPDAGRLDLAACMAKPLSSSPSASCSTFFTSPL